MMGFLILSDPPRFVKWGMSVRDFRKLYPDVLEGNGQFKFPIRVGDLKIDSGVTYSKNLLEGSLTGSGMGTKTLREIAQSFENCLSAFRVDVTKSERSIVLETGVLSLELHYSESPEHAANADKIQFLLKILPSASGSSHGRREKESDTDRYRREFGY